MKKLLILLTLVGLNMSCSIKEKPKFLRVDNIQVLESTSNYISVSADAYFLNPNDIGGELKSDGIKVIVNDNEMATVSSESFKVPANKEFSMPLRANIPIDHVISDKSLGSLLGSLLSKKLKVQYKGQIEYKALGFSYSYDIDKIDQIDIKI